MGYRTPPIYVVIHVCAGYLAYRSPWIWPLAVLYNGVQLVTNSRYFLFSWKIKRGNSLGYTVYKLCQYGLGWCLAYVACVQRT